MKTLAVVFTRGDDMTQPGGIVLAKTGDGYAVHNFNRKRGELEIKERYWGSYPGTQERALEVFNEKRQRALRFDRGGSLIPTEMLATELASERAENNEPA